MSLTFGELRELEKRVLAEYEAVSNLEIDKIIDSSAELLQKLGCSSEQTEIALRLAEHARNAKSERARSIAAGTLIYIREFLASDSGKAGAILRFARHRVETLELQGLYWSKPVLSEREESDARALFEAAIGDSTYSSAHLEDVARTFIAEHKGEAYMFGRLAADLELLLEVSNESKYGEEAKGLARAALTYFAETADAIPDDFGLVGLLDDSFIVQQAIDQILPGRAGIKDYLESVIRKWPFLANLRFNFGGETHPISDFLLTNSALVTDQLDSQNTSSAILLPEKGPLPYLLGLVAALAVVAAAAETEQMPVLQQGDRLVDRDGKGEVVFQSYVRLQGTECLPCNYEDATHIQVVYPKRRGRAEVRQTIPVYELGNFRRSSGQYDKRRVARIKVDVANRKAGPLEQLFGLSSPIILDSALPATVVVSPIGRTKNLAEELDLFGFATADVVPTAGVHRGEQGFGSQMWGKEQMGGEPILYVLKSIDEAYEYVIDRTASGRPVSSVIAPVRLDSSDAVQLSQIIRAGTNVLALVHPEDQQSLEILRDASVSFWNWNDEWFGALHWQSDFRQKEHPISRYESSVRSQVQGHTTAEPVAFRELDEAGRLLNCLSSRLGTDDESSLADWINRAWRVFLVLCRQVVPLSHKDHSHIAEEISALDDLQIASRRRWAQQDKENAAAFVERMLAAFDQVAKQSPKLLKLKQLVSDCPELSIVTLARYVPALEDLFVDSAVTVCSRMPNRPTDSLGVVPAWYGKGRMDTWLRASTFLEVRVLTYEAESAWWAASRRRRERARAFASELVRENSHIPLPSIRPDQPVRSDQIPKIPIYADVDEMVQSSIRRIATRRRDGDLSDDVDANLVGFVGGAWAAFTDRHRLNTVTHLFHGSTDSDQTQGLSSTFVDKTQPGDVVLMLSGSDRDAIRELVQSTLALEVIDAAELWKIALKRFAKSASSLEEVRAKLASEGCTRSIATIRYWLTDDYVIGPQRTAEDVEAIARVTGSKLLIPRLKECVEAIGEVRGAHLVAGRKLAAEVLARAQDWIDAGATPDELVEMEGRVILATVEFVDRDKVCVPQSIVNRLQSAE